MHYKKLTLIILLTWGFGKCYGADKFNGAFNQLAGAQLLKALEELDKQKQELEQAQKLQQQQLLAQAGGASHQEPTGQQRVSDRQRKRIRRKSAVDDDGNPSGQSEEPKHKQQKESGAPLELEQNVSVVSFEQALEDNGYNWDNCAEKVKGGWLCKLPDCAQCSFKQEPRSKSDVVSHVLSRLGIKRFKCLKCSGCFAQQKNLTLHIANRSCESR